MNTRTRRLELFKTTNIAAVVGDYSCLIPDSMPRHSNCEKGNINDNSFFI